MARASIRDVAALADVSVGTVSMVLNNSNKVSIHTRMNVLDAIKKLNYKRNPYARSLSLNKSHNIGFIVTDLTNPYFGMMVGHLQQEVNSRENSLMLGMTENTVRLEKRLIESLVNSGVDGLIIVPAHERDPDIAHIHALLSQKIPTVFISSHYTGIESNCVMTDLAKGSYDMTRYLLETGHRNILYISGYRGLVLSELRIQGFVEAHRDMGLLVAPDQIVEADPIFQGGYSAAKQALGAKRPDAIMAINDVLCMGVLSYLHEAGLSVPDDISVAGYDDLLYSGMLETPLTTVRQPIQEMCACAVEMLFHLIHGGETNPKPLLLAPTLIVRTSTKSRRETE